MAKREQKEGRKKVRVNIPTGIVHIQATFNNTIVTFTDDQGNTIAWASGGTQGFKGSRKGTPFAAQLAASAAAKKAMEQLLCSCTVLKYLHLWQIHGFISLHIASTNL